jgi:type I restriction enzyme, S subunit
MANVSSSNGLEKRPKLRFPGFDEQYKQCRIGDIYAERSQRGASDMELLSVTMNDGVKPRSEIEGKDNSSEDKSNYKIVRKGDMVYNSMRMWQGANGISPCDGIVSPAYTVLMPKQEINNGYFAALFKSTKLINEFRKNSQGMTSDTWNLKYPQIETIKVQIPSVSEQDKVSALFSVLDARIVAQAQLVESLKKYKRGVVRTLLSPKHCKLKNVEWTTAKIGDIGTFIKGAPLSKADISSDGTPFILYGELYTTYNEVISKVVRKTQASVDKQYYSQIGDVIIPTSGETPEEISTASCVMLPDIILAGDLNIYRCTQVDGRIMSYILNHVVNDRIARVAQGKSIVHVQATEISKIEITYPDLISQKKLIETFDAITARIDQSMRELELLQVHRKALLQQLFI